MKSIPIARACAELEKLIEEVSAHSEPVQILGEHGDAVLVSAADWRSMQETIYLSSIPGMRESLLEGVSTPVEDCVTELDW